MACGGPNFRERLESPRTHQPMGLCRGYRVWGYRVIGFRVYWGSWGYIGIMEKENGSYYNGGIRG